jgi:hypothetical protein
LLYLPCRVLSFHSSIHHTRKLTEERYLGLEQRKLRYFDAEGKIIPTPEEATDQQRQEKEIAQQRAERLAEKLRSLGVDPDILA